MSDCDEGFEDEVPQVPLRPAFANDRMREDLSDFNRAVMDEIDRRNIDAIVEPEMSKEMPTTIRFRAPNGDFVWLPIVRYSVVDGPKEKRAKRAVDRMLAAIANVSIATFVHHMGAVLDSRNASKG